MRTVSTYFFLYTPSYIGTAFIWKNKNHLFLMGILKLPKNKKILQTEKTVFLSVNILFCYFQNNWTLLIVKPRKKNLSQPGIRIGTYVFALCRNSLSMERLKC